MKRDADLTRTRLLEAAYEEMHLHGFQGLRVEAVLKKTDLQKGAFYHHFKSKKELALAVIDEVIGDQVRKLWTDLLDDHPDPLSAIAETIIEAERSLDPAALHLGCPLNNLAQEMSPIDEQFRRHIDKHFTAWQQSIASALRRGRDKGTVASSVDPEGTAVFILAALEGCIGRAKASHNMDDLKSCAMSLIDYLNSLRPAK